MFVLFIKQYCPLGFLREPCCERPDPLTKQCKICPHPADYTNEAPLAWWQTRCIPFKIFMGAVTVCVSMPDRHGTGVAYKYTLWRSMHVMWSAAHVLMCSLADQSVTLRRAQMNRRSWKTSGMRCLGTVLVPDYFKQRRSTRCGWEKVDVLNVKSQRWLKAISKQHNPPPKQKTANMIAISH